MKLWLSKNSEVPVRSQLVAQITIGIACGDLAPGEKLPSTRELARRFNVHQNTVSGAYQELVSQGLIEVRKGSGAFVCVNSEPRPAERGLEFLIDKFLHDAEVIGHSRDEASRKLAERLRAKRADGFLVVESNRRLREILVAEIETATSNAVTGIGLDQLASIDTNGFQLVAMFDEADKLNGLLPSGHPCIFLRANSAAASLAGRERPSEFELTGIASGWSDFLNYARLFLLAAKIDSDAIVLVSTNEPGWKHSLKGASRIICDTVTANALSGDPRVMTFPIIAESSLDELRRAACPTN
jgi:DNA-binding transcriptional regulator YhcF (GntR family)